MQICDWFSGGGVGVWDCTGSKVSHLGSVCCPLTSWSVTISRVPNSVMRNWKMAKQKLEIIWWKVDSSILHQGRIYLMFFHQLSPLKFNVFIFPFSKHGIFLFLCFFGIGTNMGKTANLFRTLISLPGSVAMPSFQSRALIMSNSAPWEGQSLGGVSVIPTPLKSPTCKEKHTSAQSHSQTDPADTVRDWSWGGGVSYAVTGPVCVSIHKLLATATRSFLPALVNSTDRHHH